MQTIRAAVIGAGAHGRYHAQKYAAMTGAELVGVVDANSERARQVAAETATHAYSDHRELLGKVDAVSIAVPAKTHYAVANDCLAQGVHVLLEKPIATRVEDAEALIQLAGKHQCVLQIGHLERFNPVLMGLDGVLRDPLFIECNRISPFNPRGTDVSVVLDLMIHDIDLILALVDAPIQRIDANGVAVLTPGIDIATARLQFENGCTANITASRVSDRGERRMRIFQQDAYISLDLGNRRCTVRRKGGAELYPGIPGIVSEDLEFTEHDALEQEISAFLSAVKDNTSPVVSGQVGLRALQTASEIMQLLKHPHTSPTAAVE